MTGGPHVSRLPNQQTGIEHFLTKFNHVDQHFDSLKNHNSADHTVTNIGENTAQNYAQTYDDPSLSSTSNLCLQLHYILVHEQKKKSYQLKCALASLKTKIILGVLIVGLIGSIPLIPLIPIQSFIALSLLIIAIGLCAIIGVASIVASTSHKEMTTASRIRNFVINHHDVLLVNSIQSKLDDLRERKARLEASLQSLTIADQKKETLELNYFINQLRCQVDRHNAAKDEITMIIHREARLNDILPEISAEQELQLYAVYSNFLGGAVSQFEREIFELQSMQLNKEVIALSFRQLDSLSEKYNSIENRYKDQEAAYHNEIAHLRDQAQYIQREKNGLRLIQDANTHDIVAAQHFLKEKNELRSQLEAVLRSNRDLVNEITTLKEQYEISESRCYEQSLQIKALTERLIVSESMLGETQTRMKRAERTRNRLSIECRAQKIDIKNLREELANAQEMFSRENIHFSVLQREYNELVDKNDTLILTLQNENERLANELQRLEKENTKAKGLTKNNAPNDSSRWKWRMFSGSRSKSNSAEAGPGTRSCAEAGLMGIAQADSSRVLEGGSSAGSSGNVTPSDDDLNRLPPNNNLVEQDPQTTTDISASLHLMR